MVDILEFCCKLVEARNRNILGWSGTGKLSEDLIVNKVSNLFFYIGCESSLISNSEKNLSRVICLLSSGCQERHYGLGK